MKKLVFTILGLIVATTMFAQDKPFTPKAEFYLTSREVYRGVGLGYSPSVGAKVSYNVGNWFTLTSKGMAPINIGGGYGPYLENGVTVNYKKFDLSVKDMFFFVGDNATGNDYFNWSKDTRHLINAEIKYSDEKVYGLVQATVYKAETDENNGVYFETGYKIGKNLDVTLGYVTDASTMNFRTAGGFTGIGIRTTRETKIGENFNPKITAGLTVNPSSKNVVDVLGVSNTPIQMALGVVF